MLHYNFPFPQNYTARPGQPITLYLVPYDLFNRPTVFVFGLTQLTGDGSVPSGRLAQYIDLSDEQDVCQYNTYTKLGF